MDRHSTVFMFSIITLCDSDWFLRHWHFIPNRGLSEINLTVWKIQTNDRPQHRKIQFQILAELVQLDELYRLTSHDDQARTILCHWIYHKCHCHVTWIAKISEVFTYLTTFTRSRYLLECRTEIIHLHSQKKDTFRMWRQKFTSISEIVSFSLGNTE